MNDEAYGVSDFNKYIVLMVKRQIIIYQDCKILLVLFFRLFSLNALCEFLDVLINNRPILG